MPFKSKAHTKKANLELARDIGLARAFEEAGLSKEAGLEKMVGGLLGRTAHLWAPAAAGGIMAGPEYRTEGAIAGLGVGALGKRIGLEALRRGIFAPGELQKAMRAAKLKETSRGYEKLTKIPMPAEGKKGTRAYQRIRAALGGEGATETFLENAGKMQSQKPLYEWGGRIAGGLGGGYAASKLLSESPWQGSPIQAAPAVSDISTHYTGLVPDAGYY